MIKKYCICFWSGPCHYEPIDVTLLANSRSPLAARHPFFLICASKALPNDQDNLCNPPPSPCALPLFRFTYLGLGLLLGYRLFFFASLLFHMGVKSVEEHSVTYVLGSRALDLTMVCSTGKCRRSTGFAAAMRYCSSPKRVPFHPWRPNRDM